MPTFDRLKMTESYQKMYVLIFLFVYLQRTVEAIMLKEALIFNTDTGQLDDKEHRSNFTYWNCFLACPASTWQEHLLNANISISRKSVFLRLVHEDLNPKQSITVRICEEPIKPATIYDPKWKEFLIGYELYYDENKIKMRFESYGRFESANNGADIMSPKQPHNSSIFRYQDGKSIRFFFVDGHPTLVFHWINVLKIKCMPRQQKRIHFGSVEFRNVQDYPSDECKDYDSEYKKISFTHLGSNDTINLKDFFIKWQIIPVWYFGAKSAKLASCSKENTIPVWKEFVDEQMKKVDLYIYAAARYFKRIYSNVDVKLDFGIFGELEVKLSGSDEPEEILNVHMTDSQQRSQNITVPKIIYRIIKCKITTHNYWYVQSAAVIIHNDRIPISDSDRLCQQHDELRGWDEIKNDLTTGLTYVCPVTKELDEKLGLLGVVSNEEISHLNLDKVPSSKEQVSGEIGFVNIIDDVNEEFRSLKKYC